MLQDFCNLLYNVPIKKPWYNYNLYIVYKSCICMSSPYHTHTACILHPLYSAEQYWEAVTMSSPPRSLAVNDQIRLNYGLDVLQISWKGDDYIHHSLTSTAFGVCRNNLSVTVLPFGTICRYGCNPSKRHSYYIWHKGGQRDTDSKMAGAKKGHTWFLRSNWQDIDEDGVKLKGRQWLGSISNGTG